MNSYIVRIYRYEEGNPGVLAGLVERPEDGERRPFASFEELSLTITKMQKEVACRRKGKRADRVQD